MNMKNGAYRNSAGEYPEAKNFVLQYWFPFIFLPFFSLALFGWSSAPLKYCPSKAASTLRGYIENVSMESIHNGSGNNNGYGNFTSLSTKLQKGAHYSIELTPGFVNSPSGGIYFEYWSVYIDFNQNGIFEANELVVHGNAAVRIEKSFSVPSASLTGSTRMRIQMQPGAEQTNPCAMYAFGEVEDYTVDIVNSISANAVTRKEN